MLEFDRQSAFDPASAAEFLAALPSKPAVLLIEPRAELPGARPLLLRTADLRRRLTLLLGPRDPASKRIHLGEYAAGIRYRLTGSPFEQALVQCPGVRDCAVFGIPDDEFGEALCAYVQPQDGVELIDNDVRAYLKQHLAGYKVPKVFQFVASLPREDSGKIFKRKLRAPYWENVGRQI